MVHVTISGLPGSGTSTLVGGLCESLKWTALNGGDVFRAEASNRGLSVSAFSELCKNDISVDRELDERLIEAMKDPSGPEIVESRLAGWWAYRNELNSLRIWIEVDLDERLRRVAKREGDDVKRIEESLIRDEADRQRYTGLYEIDILSMEPYHLIVDGSKSNERDVLEIVLSALKEQNFLGA